MLSERMPVSETMLSWSVALAMGLRRLACPGSGLTLPCVVLHILFELRARERIPHALKRLEHLQDDVANSENQRDARESGGGSFGSQPSYPSDCQLPWLSR